MAAGNWILYNKARKKIVNGTIDLNTSAFRMKMFKAGASASVSVSTLSLLSQIGSTNYTANMSTYPLVAATVTAIAASATHKFTANNIVVTASGGDASVQYAALYTSLSAGGGHMLAWCKLSTAGFAVTSTNTLTVTTPTNGFFVIY